VVAVTAEVVALGVAVITTVVVVAVTAEVVAVGVAVITTVVVVAFTAVVVAITVVVGGLDTMLAVVVTMLVMSSTEVAVTATAMLVITTEVAVKAVVIVTILAMVAKIEVVVAVTAVIVVVVTLVAVGGAILVDVITVTRVMAGQQATPSTRGLVQFKKRQPVLFHGSGHFGQNKTEAEAAVLAYVSNAAVRQNHTQESISLWNIALLLDMTQTTAPGHPPMLLLPIRLPTGYQTASAHCPVQLQPCQPLFQCQNISPLNEA
jgi:hypothetical protein